MKNYLNNTWRNLINKKNKYKNFIVLLDAGHGGIIDGEYVTPGKRSPKWKDGEQYFEGVGNREVVEKVIDKLKIEGIDYRLLHDPQIDTRLSKRKIRANGIIEKYANKHIFGMSIHSNGFSKESAHGWQVHVYKNKEGYTTEKSLELAKIASNNFDILFPEERNRGIIRNNLYMTRETSCPFILFENFFHTNKRECQKILQTEKGQDLLADLIFYTITDYISKYI